MSTVVAFGVTASTTRSLTIDRDAGRLTRPYLVQAAFSGSGSVSVEGRLHPDLPWYQITLITASEIVPFEPTTELQFVITVVSGSVSVAVDR